MDIKENENECFILTNENMRKKIDYRKNRVVKKVNNFLAEK